MFRRRDRVIALAGAVVAMGLVLAGPSEAAAEQQVGTPLRLGVTLPYGIQLGGRLTAGFELPILEADPEARWRTTFFAGPELGVYTRPANYTSALVGGVFGYRMESPGGCCVHELAVSLAYVAESHVMSVDVDLGSGELSEDRALKNHGLGAFHYTFAVQLLDRWGWYLDLGVGQLTSYDLPSALYFAGETGVQVRFDLFGGAAE